MQLRRSRHEIPLTDATTIARCGHARDAVPRHRHARGRDESDPPADEATPDTQVEPLVGALQGGVDAAQEIPHRASHE